MLKISFTGISQCTHGHFWPWAVAHFRRFRGQLRMVWRDQKYVDDLPLRFEMQLNTLGFLGVSGKDSGRPHVGAVPRKPFSDMYWYEPFSMFWRAELTSEDCPNILDTPYICNIRECLQKFGNVFIFFSLTAFQMSSYGHSLFITL